MQIVLLTKYFCKKLNVGKIGVFIKSKIIIIAGLICFLISTHLFGWGNGHDNQTTLIFENLPSEINNMFSPEDMKEARHGSHYPDSFDPFGDEVDVKSKEFLNNNNIKIKYKLHKIKGQGAIFIILTDMFREGNSKGAAFWIAVLGHSFGDAGAPNHHPLVHWLSYMNEFQLSNGQSSKDCTFGSVSACLKTDIGKAALKQEMSGFQPELIIPKGENMAERALVKVMDIAFENAKDMAKDSGLVTQAWQDRIIAQTPEQITAAEKKAAEGWAKLIGKSSKRTINTVNTAYYLAKNNIPLTQQDLDNALNIHQERFNEAIAKRSLTNDSIYEGLLETNRKSAKVAVVLEPTYEMNYGQLGFGSKYYAAAAMLALKQANIDYLPLDIRELALKDLPSSEEIPLLILSSEGNPQSFGSIDGGKICKALEKYEKDGGKIIQIGKNPIKALEIIRKYENNVDKKLKLPPGIDDILKSQLVLYSKSGNKQILKITTSPFTKAGWHQPQIKKYFSDLPADLTPCVELISGDKSYIIGVYEKSDKGINCFLPELSLAPFISEGQKSTDVSKASFDDIGKNFFLNIVKEMLDD